MTALIERKLLSICGVSSLNKKIELTHGANYVRTFAISVEKNSILYDLMKNVTQKLFEAGILQYSYKLQEVWGFPINPPEPEDKRRIFSMNDLGYGFEIWLIACGISTFVFVIEILYFWLPKIMGKIVEFLRSIIALSILLVWIKNHLNSTM